MISGVEKTWISTVVVIRVTLKQGLEGWKFLTLDVDYLLNQNSLNVGK